MWSAQRRHAENANIEIMRRQNDEILIREIVGAVTIGTMETINLVGVVKKGAIEAAIELGGTLIGEFGKWSREQMKGPQAPKPPSTQTGPNR